MPAAPVPAQAPDAAGVRAAVERANSPEVWGAALRRGDPAPLAAVWAGDPLDYFSREVRAYHARGLRILSSLVDLEFLHVDVLPDGQAVAETRERWTDRLCSLDGELRGTRAAVLNDSYELAWRGEAWWVVGVEIAVEEGSLDWTPPGESAEPDAACAEAAAADR
ncbi:MAG TPA: hypothetical protein VFE37_31280 [Chloroflexota bacterium]|nr:hypothetical protein [Chloroflexota bacterium]